MDDLCKSYFGIDSNTYVTNVVKQTLAADAISAAEGLEVTDEDYEAMLKDYASAYGFEDPAEFEKEIGKVINTDGIFNTYKFKQTSHCRMSAYLISCFRI